MKKKTAYLTAMVFSLMAIFSVPHKAMAADDETNKKILKDAIVGAVTGATATEATKEDPKESAEGHRPPGWDKGKKEGWNGGDEPPGFAKGKKED